MLTSQLVNASQIYCGKTNNTLVSNLLHTDPNKLTKVDYVTKSGGLDGSYYGEAKANHNDCEMLTNLLNSNFRIVNPRYWSGSNEQYCSDLMSAKVISVASKSAADKIIAVNLATGDIQIDISSANTTRFERADNFCASKSEAIVMEKLKRSCPIDAGKNK
jgi:hypothetical protein